MTSHWPILIELDDQDGDFGSPSQFVTAVQERLGPDHVEDVFRTAGRFDAVVFLKKSDMSSDDKAIKIMGIPGVRRALPLPDRAHDD